MIKKLLPLLSIFLHFLAFSQVDEISLISWNIRDFGKSKNSEELNQIAEIVKEADILAIQEVVSGYGGAQAVAKLADILNRKGNKWDYVVSNPTNSPKYMTERYAFVWKTKYIKIKNRGRLMVALDSLVDREPFLLEFYVRKQKFGVLNFHSRPYNKDPRFEIEAISEYIISSLKGPLLLAGDFNMTEKNDAFSLLLKDDFLPSVFNQKTTLKVTCRNSTDSYLNYAIDNIFYSKEIERTDSGVLDFVNFCSNLEKARKLSDHLPIFLQFRLLD